MNIKRKFYQGKAATDGLGPRQVRVVISTESTDRAGDVVVQDGMDLTDFQKNPIVLWNHDQNQPVARCLEILRKDGITEALVEFFEEGVDPTADRVCRLVKSGGVSGVSVGFNPTEVKPLKSGGFEFTKAVLMEFSFCSIPAQADALVVQRALGGAGAADDPIAIRLTGPMTEEQRKRITDMWSAYKGGSAPLVLEPGQRLVTRSMDRIPPAGPVLKSLYDVSRLAGILSDCGYLHSNVAWETAYEEDGSPVPAMLADAMNRLGEALLAMTAEEVAELLAQCAGATGKDAAVTMLKSFGAIATVSQALAAAPAEAVAAAAARLGDAPAAEPPPDPPDAVEKDVRARLAKAHEYAAL